jgi:hypothetical protein
MLYTIAIRGKPICGKSTFLQSVQKHAVTSSSYTAENDKEAIQIKVDDNSIILVVDESYTWTSSRFDAVIYIVNSVNEAIDYCELNKKLGEKKTDVPHMFIHRSGEEFRLDHLLCDRFDPEFNPLTSLARLAVRANKLSDEI